jgi:AcrR family transcriptional regulator
MLEIGARVFGRRGFHAASMDEIARECGVTKPMLYAYFESKEGLYLATVDRAGRYLVASIRELLSEPDPRARLQRGVDLLLRFIDRDRHGWAVLFAEGLGGAPVAAHVAAYRAQIAQAAARTLVEAAGAKARRDALRRAEPYAVGMLGAGEALARWWLAQPNASLQQALGIAGAVVDAVLETYLAAAVPAAPPRPARRSSPGG